MNHKYLTIDAMVAGTGIRDSYDGCYVELSILPISDDLRTKFVKWLDRYKCEHDKSFFDDAVNQRLDEEGLKICKALKAEMPTVKIEYFSAAYAQKTTFLNSS
jgi:hypothetical protein